MVMKRSILLMLFLSASLVCLAQFNVKVGYGFVYTPAPVNSDMIADFNRKNEMRLDREMTEVHFLSGIEVGLNYRFENLGIEFSYDNLTTDKDALGEDTTNGSIFTEKLYWGLSGYSLAIENIWGNFGYGIGLGRRKHKVQENIATTNEKRSIMQESINSTKVYAILHLGGNETISFQVRPFINIPWKSTNLSSVRENLEVGTSNDSMEKFVTYGISFAFYNGPQT